MANTIRYTTLLPTIRCSDCNAELEISMMGDHVCDGEAPAPSHPLSTIEESEPEDVHDYSSSSPQHPTFLAPPLAKVPHVDRGSNYTHDPNAYQDPLTPASTLSHPRSPSPAPSQQYEHHPSPDSYSDHVYANPYSHPPTPPCIDEPYSVSNPHLDHDSHVDHRHHSIPSPPPPPPPPPAPPAEQTTNFPLARPRAPSSARTKPNLNLGPIIKTPLDGGTNGPMTPRTPGGSSFLKRMNTMAHGPFSRNRKNDSIGGNISLPLAPPVVQSPPVRHSRIESTDSVYDDDVPSENSRGNSYETVQAPPSPKPSAPSHSPLPSPPVPRTTSSPTTAGAAMPALSRVDSRGRPLAAGPPPRPARPEVVDGFLGQLQQSNGSAPATSVGFQSRPSLSPATSPISDIGSSDMASQSSRLSPELSSPTVSGLREPSRTRVAAVDSSDRPGSAAGSASGDRQWERQTSQRSQSRGISADTTRQRYPTANDHSRHRSASRGYGSDDRSASRDVRTEGSPTSTEYQSSYAGTYDQQPTHPAPSNTYTKANSSSSSDYQVGNPYHAPSESASSFSSASGPGEGALSSRSSLPTSNGSTFSQHNRSFDRTNSSERVDAYGPQDLHKLAHHAESRDGHAHTHHAIPSPTRQSITANFSRPRAPELNIPVPAPMATTYSASPTTESPVEYGPRSDSMYPPAPSDHTASRPRPPRRGTDSKGDCRECQLPITGRSIKAADGRLTGRYHRECFVCTTCKEPFSTADFYVLNNQPYCAAHYHELNGSLCSVCCTGIEGQYLETADQHKFHPGCFTCDDCLRPLDADYFEINGRPYCEPDALRVHARANRHLGGAGKRFPERRTTKLMMMMI